MTQVEAYTRLAGIYDEIVVDPCFGDWAAFLDSRWRGDPVGVTRVLDVCCGTGLLAAELIDRGYEPTGVDASSAMLDRARALLGSEVDLVLATLPDLPVAGPFDAAVSTFDGLNYLPLADFRRSLAAVAAKLRDDGWFVFDLHTDAMLALARGTPVVEGEHDGTRYVIRNVVEPAGRTCRATIDVTGAGDEPPFSEEHLQYFHSDDEVRAALSDAGFGAVIVTDEYTDLPATAETLRATWTARLR